jgi:hypothetical protein
MMHFPFRSTAIIVLLLLCGAGVAGIAFRASKSGAARAQTLPQRETGTETHAAAPAGPDLIEQLRRREQLPEAKSAPIPTAEDYAKRRCVQLLAQQSEYVLSGEEVEAVSQKYAYYESVRGAFELSIAKVSASAGTLRVDIPAYPSAGAQIEQMMRRDFEQILGPDRAQGLWQLLADSLREDFAQFGTATQAVSAAVSTTTNGEAQYRIRRTAEWVGADGHKRSSGSDAHLLASQIAETDYVYLGPLLGQLGSPSKS